jgi:hypothetical protein
MHAHVSTNRLLPFIIVQLKGQTKHTETQVRDLEGQIAALQISTAKKDNEYAKFRNQKEEEVRYHQATLLWEF